MDFRRVHFSSEVKVYNKEEDDLSKLLETESTTGSQQDHSEDGSEQTDIQEGQKDDIKTVIQSDTQKRVRFASQVQYHEITSDYEKQTKQKYFAGSQWKQYHEVSRDIKELSGLHVLDDDKVLEDALESITGKLEQQMKYLATWSFQMSSQANSSPGLAHVTITNTDENEEVTGDTEQPITQKGIQHIHPCRTVDRKKLFQEMATTDAQRAVLSATEANSMAHIMAEHEIVHKEMDTLAQEAVQNHWWVAKQFTNDDAAATHLIQSIKRKAEDENKKWSEVAKKVGQNKADELRARVDEIDSSASRWRKERQKRLDLATKLMAAVDKEKSIKVRTQMVGQRPDLSREVIIVEAAKIVSGIKRMLPHYDAEQVLDEQQHYLTTKMSQQQASEAIQEVYRTLNEENYNHNKAL